jgi:hypothetical protein
MVKTNVVITAMEDVILSPLKKLIDIFTFLINWIRAIGSIETQFQLISNSKLPKKSQINSLVRSFIFLLEKPLLGYLSTLCSKGIFIFNIVYLNEKKHPNFKIVESLLKNTMLKSPELSKICYFFPTPISDSLTFGKRCSMKPCFLKNKINTMSMQIFKKQIKEIPVSLRSRKYTKHRIIFYSIFFLILYFLHPLY